MARLAARPYPHDLATARCGDRRLARTDGPPQANCPPPHAGRCKQCRRRTPCRHRFAAIVGALRAADGGMAIRRRSVIRLLGKRAQEWRGIIGIGQAAIERLCQPGERLQALPPACPQAADGNRGAPIGCAVSAAIACVLISLKVLLRSAPRAPWSGSGQRARAGRSSTSR